MTFHSGGDIDPYQDVNAILTPTATEQEIVRLSRKCEEATIEIAARARRAAESEVNYKVSWAKALLKAEGKTVAEREAVAIQVVEDEYRERKISEALLLSATEAARSYRAQLSAMQTLARNVSYDAGLR